VGRHSWPPVSGQSCSAQFPNRVFLGVRILAGCPGVAGCSGSRPLWAVRVLGRTLTCAFLGIPMGAAFLGVPSSGFFGVRSSVWVSEVLAFLGVRYVGLGVRHLRPRFLVLAPMALECSARGAHRYQGAE
jgi:hypothetical protein